MRHEAELAESRRQARDARQSASVARRRLLFFASFIIAIVGFFLLDLAVGLKSAWSVVIAVGVLAGLLLGISQWARWHSDGDGD
jgi:hypothetical protein